MFTYLVHKCAAVKIYLLDKIAPPPKAPRWSPSRANANIITAYKLSFAALPSWIKVIGSGCVFQIMRRKYCIFLPGINKI